LAYDCAVVTALATSLVERSELDVLAFEDTESPEPLDPESRLPVEAAVSLVLTALSS
jgi:hypothetical protein